MRIIGYFRYDPNAPSNSPASRSWKERDFHEYCLRHDHTLVELLAEPEGEPEQAWEALHGLMQRISQEGAHFLVAVHDPTHLGPTLEQAVEAFLALDGLGCQVICTDAQTPDPLQGLLKAFLNRGIGAERRYRIREAMKAKALLGEGLGKTAYGYRIGRGGGLEQVSQESELVQLMFRLYLEEGMGVRRIAGYLNERGFHTRRGQPWSMVSVRAILRNHTYIGTYTRFGLRVPGSHPRLVSAQEFRRAQDIMQERSPRRGHPRVQPFLLSGLVYCGQCGNRMIGVTRRQTWRRRDGSRMHGLYRYYQCQSRTNQSRCDYHTWRAADLEAAVEVKARQELLEWETGDQGSVPAKDDGTMMKREEAWRRRYLRYLRRTTDGAISLSTLSSLLHRLAQERQASEEDALLSDGNGGTSGWQARRTALRSLVDYVEVSAGEIDIRFKATPAQ